MKKFLILVIILPGFLLLTNCKNESGPETETKPTVANPNVPNIPNVPEVSQYGSPFDDSGQPTNTRQQPVHPQVSPQVVEKEDPKPAVTQKPAAKAEKPIEIVDVVTDYSKEKYKDTKKWWHRFVRENEDEESVNSGTDPMSP